MGATFTTGHPVPQIGTGQLAPSSIVAPVPVLPARPPPAVETYFSDVRRIPTPLGPSRQPSPSRAPPSPASQRAPDVGSHDLFPPLSLGASPAAPAAPAGRGRGVERKVSPKRHRRNRLNVPTPTVDTSFTDRQSEGSPSPSPSPSPIQTPNTVWTPEQVEERLFKGLHIMPSPSPSPSRQGSPAPQARRRRARNIGKYSLIRSIYRS